MTVGVPSGLIHLDFPHRPKAKRIEDGEEILPRCPHPELRDAAAFSLSVAGVYALLGGSWSAALPWAQSEEALVMLPVHFLMLTLTDGLGEEPAWRGFALPRLLTRHNALVASLILGVLWALWHLPLFWIEGSDNCQGLVWVLVVGDTAKAVLFTWVYSAQPRKPAHGHTVSWSDQRIQGVARSN